MTAHAESVVHWGDYGTGNSHERQKAFKGQHLAHKSLTAEQLSYLLQEWKRGR